MLGPLKILHLLCFLFLLFVDIASIFFLFSSDLTIVSINYKGASETYFDIII